MTPTQQKTEAARIRLGLPTPDPQEGRKMTTTVAEKPATEEQVYACELRLGDVITRVPGTDMAVRWHALSDPVTGARKHMSILVAMDGEWGGQRTLLYFVDNTIIVDSSRRPAARKVSA